MKEYFVSIALKVPCNFEIKVKAGSEKQAFEIALEEWRNKRDIENITEPMWDELRLDENVFKDINSLESAVFIEENKNL